MTFRDDFALGVDVSSHQPTVDWQLLKAGNVSWAAARSSFYDVTQGGFVQDSCFANHVQGAHDVRIPLVAYHVLVPGYYAAKLQDINKLKDLDKWLPVDKDEQFQCMVNSLRFKTYNAIAIDYEISAGWDGKVMGDAWLYEVWKQYVIRVRKAYPDKLILTYTAPWFVNGYCKSIQDVGLKETINGERVDVTSLWVAYYPYNKNTVILNSWSLLKANYPPDNMEIDGRITQNPPYMGWSGWKGWQFTGDKFKLPGVKGATGQASAVDLDLYNGTKEQLYAWLKYTDTSEDEHEEEDQEEDEEEKPENDSTLKSIYQDVQAIRSLLERIYR